PSCRNAGIACWVVDTAMRARTARTSSPHISTSTRKKRSATGKRPPRRRTLPGELGAVDVPAVTLRVVLLGRRDRQLAQLGLGLVEDGGRELGVIDGAGDALALAVDKVEETLEGLALGLAGLRLVSDEPRGRGDRIGGLAVGVERVVAEVGVDSGRL